MKKQTHSNMEAEKKKEKITNEKKWFSADDSIDFFLKKKGILK